MKSGREPAPWAENAGEILKAGNRLGVRTEYKVCRPARVKGC
ncbi:hypothetical protein [Hydrogeniiclostridium mannosilyticum]|nr:hypothetical protein [Hydrogeniiclostridium mannosilyticum]